VYIVAGGGGNESRERERERESVYARGRARARTCVSLTRYREGFYWLLPRPMSREAFLAVARATATRGAIISNGRRTVDGLNGGGLSRTIPFFRPEYFDCSGLIRRANTRAWQRRRRSAGSKESRTSAKEVTRSMGSAQSSPFDREREINTRHEIVQRVASRLSSPVVRLRSTAKRAGERFHVCRTLE